MEGGPMDERYPSRPVSPGAGTARSGGKWEEKRLNVIDKEQASVCCRWASAVVEKEKKEVDRLVSRMQCSQVLMWG
ncbi:hypothetical protein PAMP_006299 [Pampus punctatissimus]